ncbi:hypothetical protein [Cyanobacterium sp. Dongsha4]|uniref:hypothetical protein n=1 Tax=Cyanobacterium sp. DS4 TaxID=2878255 RepID=UPI002E8134BE|nr:hypothetical protein [Cyanobacterium sp. Dongsha4]WVL02510.1 hypothetical protein Dongsha4_18620 [Cyanobacterium sp. Dongsha4]
MAVIEKSKIKSAAAKFSERCDCVIAVEHCTVRTLSDGVYFIDIDEEITPSRYAHDIKYYVDED